MPPTEEWRLSGTSTHWNTPGTTESAAGSSTDRPRNYHSKWAKSERKTAQDIMNRRNLYIHTNELT